MTTASETTIVRSRPDLDAYLAVRDGRFFASNIPITKRTRYRREVEV